MFIIRNKKIFIGISATLVSASLVMLFVLGVPLGIDFKGGAITEIEYIEQVLLQDELENLFDNANFGHVLIQPVGAMGYILKTDDLDDAKHKELLRIVSKDGSVQMRELEFNSIGPSVGRELARKAIIAIILVSLGIIFFIAFAFREVSKPVSSWKYGLIAIVALIHDVLIPVGIFTLLAHYASAEINTLFVVGVLTILGLSVSDTIVIFDRIRENLKNEKKPEKVDFAEVVGRSLNQSFVRSIATSLTMILALVALIFFGPVTTKYLAIMLISGMFFGTYSSIFLASPLMVLVQEWQNARSKS